MTQYPIKVKASAKFLDDLYHCEYGRYEDAVSAREDNDTEAIEAEGYGLVYCDFGKRFKTQIEIRNDAELSETWYALASGTIGLYNARTANRMLDELRPIASSVCPEMVNLWPFQDGF